MNFIEKIIEKGFNVRNAVFYTNFYKKNVKKLLLTFYEFGCIINTSIKYKMILKQWRFGSNKICIYC